jgi:hypothetical protein
MTALRVQYPLLTSAVVHTSNSLKLVKPAPSRFADRRISYTCTAEIALHWYRGYALSQLYDALCFVLQLTVVLNCSSAYD